MAPGEQPHQRQKNRRPLAKILKESHQEAFSKDSKIIKAAGEPIIHHQRYVCPGGVLPSDISFLGDGHLHWPSWLWCPWSPGKVDWPEGSSGCPLGDKKLPERHPFLPVSAPNWIIQNHGSKRASFPEALKWWAGLSFCPWCGKEGQYEGTVVNHLCTVHYCLGLMCALCWDFFATSADTIRWHTSPCEALTT